MDLAYVPGLILSEFDSSVEQLLALQQMRLGCYPFDIVASAILSSLARQMQ
jgi:hypothetical protein